MNWIVASLLMLVFSNIYYLTMRVAQQRGIDAKYYMVANFSIPAVLYFVLGRSAGYNFWLTPIQYAAIALNAIVFSYIGSVISYHAMKKAPNAGYSVIIQKSYGIYTAILSVLFFGSALPAWKFGAILLVVVSTGIVMGLFEKKIPGSSKGNVWIWLSLIAFFCFGTLQFIAQWIARTWHIPTPVYLMWVMIIVDMFSIGELVRTRHVRTLTWNMTNIALLAGIGVSVTGFYYFLQAGQLVAPNIGYVGAINTASNAVLTLLAAWLLKDKFSWKRFIGVVGVSIGVMLLVI